MPIELDELAGPDGGEKGRRLAAYWIDQINSIRDSTDYKRWFKRGEKIEKRYRDERSATDEDGARRYNALWSNVEILKPALYGRMPLPVAERKFKDQDPAGRHAAGILERALRNEVEICGFNDAVKRAVSDYLLPGRGTVWVRYEPEISESISLPSEPQTDINDSQGRIDDKAGDTPIVLTAGGRMRARLLDQDTPDVGEGAQTDDAPLGPEGEGNTYGQELEQEKLDNTGDRIVRESTPVDFVAWGDFLIFPARARIWDEVMAVGKRVYMSRDQLKRRFGEKIGKAVPLEKDNRGHRDLNTTMQGPDQDKAQIYEIWSKQDRTVYWMALGYTYLCDRKDDPLRLEHFYPVPCPLFANPTNNTLVPVPDYIQYQDQAVQIDELTQRIAMLTKCCKMAGVYNAAAKDIQRLFNESVENELIPVDDWAAFAEKGGVEGNWSLMPVKEIIGIINELMMCKQKQIEEMDRLTGINDIMRGTSDARETLGGVRLKTNNTGTRLTSRQNEVARFCRDIVVIMADIMSQHFSEQSLIEASGALYEEGLGPDYMPSLSELQTPVPAPQPKMLQPPPGAGAPPGMPGLQPQLGAPQAQGQPQPPMGQPMPPPGAPPQGGMPGQSPAMGGNVVPFGRPQGQMPPPQPQGMPPGEAQPLTGEVLPPEGPEAALMAAVQRITRALQLIRNERLRGFRVDIEVDSTIFPDLAQEQEERTKFIAAITQFLQQALALGASMPEAIPLLGKILKFGVRGYRVGRDLESAIEEFTDKAPAMVRQRLEQQSNNPDPKMIQAQNDTRKTNSMIQIASMEAAADSKNADAEVERQRVENEGERTNATIELEKTQIGLEMKLLEKQIQEAKLNAELVKGQQQAAKPPAASAGA